MAVPSATASAPVEVVEDLRFQDHRGPDGHPERPERLVAIAQAIDGFRERVEIVRPRPATQNEIQRVHAARLFETLESTRGGPSGRIDADTYYMERSFDVARLAAGGTIDLLERVLSGRSARGLAAVRPPGHHAEAARSMGFCLFNNVAVAIRALQAAGGSPRLLVFDWDVHHGNGTQHIFEEDPNVLYISTHQFPFYPGTGDFGEEGEGHGRGTTINIPMPAGCGDEEYVGVVERIVVPAALAFGPDLIVVSCGFDAHRDDPLASMQVSFEGYARMASIMRSIADLLCEGRIVHVLEGGYASSGVREGAQAVLDSLVSAPAPLQRDDRDGRADLQAGTMLRNVVDGVHAIHGRRIPNLGRR